MINFLYNLLLLLALPGIVAYHGYRSVTRGRAAAFAERFGFPDKRTFESLGGADVIWVHAVSVGETIAVTPLLAALKKEWPQRKIVVSNTTETGREVAKKVGDADLCIHFPFDYSFAVGNLLQLVNPSLIIVMETEIWPNFLRCAARRGIPVVLVNGRISDRSAGRYRKLSWFFRPVLANVTALCMQSSEDVRRIVAAGAEPARTQAAGNLKYDISAGAVGQEEKSTLRGSYCLPETSLVFTAGSTHAGEDEAAIEAFRALVTVQPDAVLVLAPRHPERAQAVAELLRRSGFRFRTLSGSDSGATLAAGEVLLVDRVGELKRLYALSDLVFVGGSLAPTGGHNVLEPAAFGLPVLFGPHMTNFREISAAILKSGGAVQVADAGELAAQVVAFGSAPDRRREMGSKGLQWLLESSGSVERHMTVIRSVLQGSRAAVSRATGRG